MPKISLNNIVTEEATSLTPHLSHEQREAFIDSSLYSEIMTVVIRSKASNLVNELFHLAKNQGTEPDAKINAPYLLRSIGSDEELDILKTTVRSAIVKKLEEAK